MMRFSLLYNTEMNIAFFIKGVEDMRCNFLSQFNLEDG